MLKLYLTGKTSFEGISSLQVDQLYFSAGCSMYLKYDLEGIPQFTGDKVKF